MLADTMRMTRILAVLVLMVSIAAADPQVTVRGNAVVLRDPVYFEVAKPVIKQESYAQLDALATYLAANPKLGVIEIQSHTDERGGAAFNLKISQQRADAIRAYLIGKGVAKARLVAKGYGESAPLDKGHDEAAWAKNRRTELVILKRYTT